MDLIDPKTIFWDKFEQGHSYLVYKSIKRILKHVGPKPIPYTSHQPYPFRSLQLQSPFFFSGWACCHRALLVQSSYTLPGNSKRWEMDHQSTTPVTKSYTTGKHFNHLGKCLFTQRPIANANVQIVSCTVQCHWSAHRPHTETGFIQPHTSVFVHLHFSWGPTKSFEMCIRRMAVEVCSSSVSCTGLH